MSDGRWSESIMGDGAVILYDGQPVPIEGVVAALNYVERRREEIEPLAVAVQVLNEQGMYAEAVKLLERVNRER